MADPRIHPSTTTQEAPLIPPGTSISSHNPPPHPPPALYHKAAKSSRRRRSCFCRCFCYTFSTLLLLLIAIAAAVGILFLILKPKIPHYSINTIAITSFNLSSSRNTISSRFLISMTSYNQNKKIGIYYYEKGSRISAWMEERMLCSGTFPEFYQGHRNTTALYIPLSGESSDAAEFLKRARELQEVGAVPLVLRAKVPVRIKIGGLKLVRIKFKARCRLGVEGVSADDTIRVSSRGCRIRVAF